MSSQPLDPELVIDPTTIASFTGIDATTGIYLDADQTNSSILLNTSSTPVLYADKYQNVGINTISPNSQLTVSSSSGNCVQLRYNDSTTNKANLSVTSDGKLNLSAGGSEVSVDSSTNLNVKSHNGSTSGLMLNNTLVRSSADQLNYNIVTPGTASASKSLVLNSSSNISGINNLSATELSGTLQTASQPNVTSVGTLDGLQVAENTNIAIGNNVIDETDIGYLHSITPGTAAANKALIVNSDKDISSIRNLSATNLTGQLQTAAQPNITSVGTLTGLDMNGYITGLNQLSVNTESTGRTLVLNDENGNCLQLAYDTNTGVPITYVDMLVNNSGNLLVTPSGGSVDITTHDGSTNGLKLGGVVVQSNADEINYVHNSTPGSAVSGKALVVNSSRNIDNINNLTATNLTGTLQTASQPNVTSVNVLNIAQHDGANQGLRLNNTLITSSATEINYLDGVTPGTATASNALIVNSDKDISSIRNLTATNLTGTLQTASQPNVTSVDVLDITGHNGTDAGLRLGGELLTATATQINSIFGAGGEGTFENLTVNDTMTLGGHNGIDSGLVLGTTLVTSSAEELNYLAGSTPGTGEVSTAVVLDGNKDFSGIRNLSLEGNLTLGLTVVSETDIAKVDGITNGSASANKALVVDGNLDINGINNLYATELTGELQTASQPNVTSVGTLTSITTSGDLTLGSTVISETDIAKVDGITNGTATANKALVVNTDRDISNINSLTATNLTGTLQTASQPNITSVDVLDITGHNGTDAGLRLGGELLTATASQINSIFGGGGGGGGAFGDLTVNASLTLPNADGSTEGLILGSTLVTSSGTELNYLDGSSPGTVIESTAVVVDSNKDISSFRNLTAENFYGTLQTSSQPNVTSVGTLDNLSVSGNVTVDGVTIDANELSVIDNVTSGTASSNKAIILDNNKNISGVGQLSLDKLNLSASVLDYTITGLTNVTSGVNLSNANDLALAAYSPTLGVTIYCGHQAGSTRSYIMYANSNTGFSQELQVTPISSISGSAGPFGIVWNSSTNRFIIYFVDSDAYSSAQTFRYTTSTDGITWTTAVSTGLSIKKGSNVIYFTPSNQWIFGAEDKLYVSSNGTSWSSVTITNALPTYENTQMDSIVAIGNYVTFNLGSNSRPVMQWNGSAWSQAANITVGASTSRIAYHQREDRLYAILTNANSGGSNASITLSTIDSVSTRAPSTWVANIQSNSVTVAPFRNDCVLFMYRDNFDVVLVSRKSQTADATNTANSIRFMQFKNKALVYTFTDSPTENAGNTYRMGNIPLAVLTGSNTLVVPATKPGATVRLTYTSAFSSNNGIVFGSTTITESEFMAIDGVVAGTAISNKALVVDGSTNINGINSLTSSTLNSSALNVTTTFGSANNSSVSIYNTTNGISSGLTFNANNSSGISKTTLAILPKFQGATNGSELTGADFNVLSSGTAYTPFAILPTGGCKINGRSTNSTCLAIGTLASANGNYGDLAFESTGNTLSRFRVGFTADSTNNSQIQLIGRAGGNEVNQMLITNTTDGANITGLNSISTNLATGTASSFGAIVVNYGTTFRRIPRMTQPNALTLVFYTKRAGSNMLDTPDIATSEVTATMGSYITNTSNVYEVAGYIIPQFSETYTYTLTVQNVQFRMWLNGELVLQNWTGPSSSTNYTTQLTCVANENVPIYIQCAPIASSNIIFTLQWQSASRSFQTIPGTNLTGTSNTEYVNRQKISAANKITLYETSNTSTTPAKGEIYVDTSGNTHINPTANTIIDATSNLNIAGHGSTGFLQLAGTSVTSTATELNYLDGSTPGTASANNALVVNADKDISSIRNLTATNLTGQLQTASQPNITSVGTLTSVTTSGDLTLGSTVISETDIAKVDGVTNGTASADKALVVDGDVNITGINSLSATSITGQLQTASQPNVTSVGTLTSVTTSGDLTLGTTVISETDIAKVDGITNGSASANKALVTDANIDIIGINSLDANTLTATSINGELQTAAQPNVTSVGTLTSVTTSGDLTLGTTVISETDIAKVDGITNGSASANKALVVDGDVNITGINSLTATSLVADELTGELQTAAQPNITSVGTLTSVTTSGDLTLGTTVISETDIAKVDDITNGTAAANKALVVNSDRDISNINSLTATNLTGTLQTASQPNITSVDVLDITGHNGTDAGLRLGGELLTATATQINSIFSGGGGTGAFSDINISGSLTLTNADGSTEGLILGSTLVTASGTELNYLDGSSPGTASASKALVLDSSSDISGINSLSATSLTGELQTAAQPNITSVNVLDIEGHNGSDAGLRLGGALVTSSASELNYVDTTAGSAQASKALVLDSSSNISGINSLSATSLTGQLQTAAQPNITSVGTLTSVTTSGNLTLGSTVISETDIAKVDGITNGTAAANKALVVDGDVNISGVNVISSTKLNLGSSSNTDLPLEVNSVSYAFTGAYAYSNSENAHGVIEANAGASSANYSARFNGKILVTGEIQVTSDKRLKTNITNIQTDLAKRFIMNSEPVRYNWKDNETGKAELGWLAQDVYKLGYGLEELIDVVEQPDMVEEVDEDGFINPQGAKFTLSTGKIIPLLTVGLKDVYTELEQKNKKINELEERISKLEQLIKNIV